MNISEIAGFSVNGFNLLGERLVLPSHQAAFPAPDFNAFYFICVCGLSHMCMSPKKPGELGTDLEKLLEIF